MGAHVATGRRRASTGVRLDPSGSGQPHPDPAGADAAGDRIPREILRRPAVAITAGGRSAFAFGLLARGRALADVAGQVLQFLPHRQVALGQLVHHRPRRLADHAAHLLAELLLLVEEALHRALQVAAHETLQRVTVETDDLAEQLGRQHRLAVLLVLGDDLQQHLPGQVLARARVADLELLVVDDQLADVLDRDVAGDLGVVQATVGIFLDDADRGHGANALSHDALPHGRGRGGLPQAPAAHGP